MRSIELQLHRNRECGITEVDQSPTYKTIHQKSVGARARVRARNYFDK